MAQKFHTIRADNLEEAYRIMRETLGEDAVVVRTRDVKEGGFGGFMGKTRVELTVSAPDSGRPPRRLSPVERKYAASGSTVSRPGSTPQPSASGRPASSFDPPAVGSDERVNSTVAHFRRLLTEASKKGAGHLQDEIVRTARQNTPSKPTPVSRSSTPPRTQTSLAEALDNLVIPFPSTVTGDTPSAQSLRQELRQVRELLDVLVAETHGTGLPESTSHIYRELLDRGVPKRVLTEMVTRIKDNGPAQALHDPEEFRAALHAQIMQRVKTTGGVRPGIGSKCRVIALVGTTGVGKTTSLAKLAAHFTVEEEIRVALVTCDTYRVAAPEQLQVYADIIGLTMEVADGPEEAEAAVDRLSRDHSLVFVDTAGASQFNVRHLQELRQTLRRIRPDEVILLLNLSAHMDDLRLVLDNYACLDPASVMFTKLDETRRHGVMLAVLAELDKPVSYLSIGQDVPKDIRVADPAFIADVILEGRVDRGQASE